MYIFYTKGTDPMILDSVVKLNALHAVFVQFLRSDETKLRVEAIRSASPEPYAEQLAYIEVRKSAGKIAVALSGDRGLVISGANEYLARYVEAFEFEADEDGYHHHPEFALINENGFEMDSLRPFVEADNDYVAEHQEKSANDMQEEAQA